MLNEEKIRLMTKLAIYEQNEGRADLPLSKYYRTDYLTLKMINSAITMTIGYLLLLGTIILINAEEILSEMVSMDLAALGRNIVIIYVILFTVNMLATYFIHSYKFRVSRDNLNLYNGMLKELYTVYKKEEDTGENRFFEEDFDGDMVNSFDNEMADFGGADDDEAIDD